MRANANKCLSTYNNSLIKLFYIQKSARNHKIDEILETGWHQNQLKKSKRLNIIFSQIQGKNVLIVLIRHF